MELPLYEQIIRQCREYGIKLITLHTVGEPFMHNQLGDQLRIAHENNVSLCLSTNGQILTPQHIQRLLKFPPSYIRFSIDGATKETYEKTRLGGKFERLMRNLNLLRQSMQKANAYIPIKIGVTILEENVAELLLFFDVFKEFAGVNLSFSLPNTLSGSEDKSYFNNLGCQAVPLVPCSMLWTSPSVLYDGQVSACCRDYHGELIVGNIFESNLLDIWHGEQFSILRQKHLAGDVSDIPACNNCFKFTSGLDGAKISTYLNMVRTMRKSSRLSQLIGRAVLPNYFYHLLTRYNFYETSFRDVEE